MAIVFSSGIYNITLPNPNFGYRSRVLMPIDVLKMDDGSLVQRDEGVLYDHYSCEAEFTLSEAQTADLNNFINTSARGVYCVMTLDSTGFFPFMPHNGDGDNFTVSLRIINTAKVQHNPFRYFNVTIEITNTAGLPYYDIPDQIKNGAYTLGSVSGIREPINLFEPKQEYGVSVDFSVNSSAFYVDRGNLADVASTKFMITEQLGMTAGIINDIVTNQRISVFPLKTPQYAYPFGRDFSNLSYSVQLASSELEVVHENADRFSLVFELVNKTKSDPDYWQMKISSGEEIQMTIATGEEIQMTSF